MVYRRLKKTDFKEKLLWLLGQRKRFKIEGQSMEPLLKHSDVVFVKPTRDVTPGDLVICRHPIQSDLILIKQVESCKDDQLTLKGLNPSVSTDSRIFGPVDKGLVIGYITSVWN